MLTLPERAPEWQQRALCAEVGGDWWFPERGGSTREAKGVCSRCDVVAECLAYALETGQEHGIWGGLDERERRKFDLGTSEGEPPKVARIRRMAGKGMIDREIAATEGISPRAVGRLRASHDIPPARLEYSRSRARRAVPA